MAYHSSVSSDAFDGLADLPFAISPALLDSALVSPNLVETLNNAEHFMVVRDYRTAAALFTAALNQCLGVSAPPELAATLLCKRAECLLRLNYVQHVLRDCRAARSNLGGENEHTAFLWSQALELQGEVQKAFVHALMYRSLDPLMERDKNIVNRLREKVKWLCGQGYHQVYSTIDILMRQGELLLSNPLSVKVALDFFTEVLNLFPEIPEAHEYRAQCFFILGDYEEAKRDCNRALKLTNRTSATAFYTKIKIKVAWGQFEEALKLLEEWRMIEPDNKDLVLIKMQIREKMAAIQVGSEKEMARCQSLSDISFGYESGEQDKVMYKERVKSPPFRASKQSSGAKPKTKKQLKQEEWQREKERQEIAQELKEKRDQEEYKSKKDKAVDQKTGKQHGACEQSTGVVGAEQISPSTATSQPFPEKRQIFSERSRKRKIRRKTKTLRAAREGLNDDSDASSVCSISTCPDDLDYGKNTPYRPIMPTFEDSDQGVVSDQPSSRQSIKASEKSSSKPSGGIRRRPPGIQGPFRLCRYHDCLQLCRQGKLCLYAHSEEERKAWEEDRKKGTKKVIAKKEKAEKEQPSENPSISLKEWRQAFRGQCRAPWHIPKKGGKYKMCQSWKDGACKLNRTCTFAHGEKELTAWNEHLERMEKEMKMKGDGKEKESKIDGHLNGSLNKLDDDVSKVATKSSNRQREGVRPRPKNVYSAFRLCRHYMIRRSCPSGDQCCFAHSETEKTAWEEDRKKGSRKPTVAGGKSKRQTAKALNSLKEWRHAFRGPTGCRAPLRIPNKGGEYKMCPEWTKGTCKLDRGCTFAHGEVELKAWNEHLTRMEKEMNKKTEEKKANEQNKEVDPLPKNQFSSPKEDEPPALTYKLESLVSRFPGVNVKCKPSDLDVSLQVPLNSEGDNRYSWSFQISHEASASGHLRDIVLIPQHHKCYALSSVKFNCCAKDANSSPTHERVSDSEELSDMFHYAVKSHLHTSHSICEVEIVVSFSSPVFGNFGQVLVLDFGKEKNLAMRMSVEVGSQEFLKEFCEAKTNLTLNWPLWDNGSREIIKFEPQRPSVFNNEHLIDKYKLPKPDEIVPSALLDGSQGLSKNSYKDVMHQLLFVEEMYIRKQVARFNVQGVHMYAAKLVIKKGGEVFCAQDGWLYGTFNVSRSITPDDADGRLLLRNIFSSMGSVLIAKSQSPDALVYEALVDSVEDNRVTLKLSARCCEDLALTNNSEAVVDVQFRINRLPLCEMHDNIDRLGPEHVRILFPAFSNVASEEISQLPWILDPKLNEHQKEIIRKIAAPSIYAPPLVVFGPFGTGKTFTLNQAVRRMAVNRNNRVLICTHSNSAADLHVELLDEYLKEKHGIAACTPLRIYTPLRDLSTVSDRVKEYCLISDKAFRLPTRDEVLKHRVVVSTLGMSRALFDMELHRGFFSHILVDEAAQALETEVLAPITLAGNDTKVVFTGDHMQMSPDVFSPQAKKWGFQISLQERLFHYYRGRQTEAKLDPNVILLTENYRSNEQVLQFSSDMFYGGKLSSGSEQPLHPELGPLVFFSALGKEEIEENRSSFRNLAEVNEVVKRVKELTDCWPEAKWGPKDLKRVAVVSSYRYQVKTIRDGLRKVGLGEVKVETIENVQGKEFRALFVSTVRTFHTCKHSLEGDVSDSKGPYLYFLSDPKLLNTALTRAQSLVAVVGDPFSLKTLGDCQGLWEEFITRCSDSGNLYGIEHTELEESISQRGLNVNATKFVPGAFTNTSHSTAEEQKPNRKSRGLENTPCSKSPLFQQDLQKDPTLLSVGQRNFDDSDTRALNDHANLEDSEPESTSESDDAGDEFSESDELGNADDFAEYDNVDETVPPKHMDDIILALKAKCEENEKKRKHRDETMREKDDMGQYFAPDDASESKEIPVSNPFRLDVARKNVVHEDYKMTTRKGKTRIFLVNMKIGYSERTERLLRQPKLKEQEYLQPEYLEQLLQKEPELYRQCSLRISYDGTRTSYGEIQDVATEDILIEGNTRQCFDGDSVVVKLTNEPSGEGAAPQTTKEGMKGEIVGVKNRMINQRGRQFVCTISRENPWVMYPINRSMTPIGNLRDESCKGVPIYSKIQAESAEKAVLVETLSLKEALSGKYLFVVQYLQWKRTFPYPLGIVTKKIRRGYGLPEAIKPLDAEYQLKGSFPYDVEKEVERQINACSRITRCERESRQDVKRAFTIDPPGSRALDDALTTEKLENNLHRVGVHIADVSYFVQPGSRLDAEAQKRGHRFGDVLMLPEYLSFDVCSLLPNQERLAVSVYMVLDQDGNVQREEELDFCRTIVKSQCQLTYAEAQQVILGNSIRNRPHNNGNVTPEIEQSIRTLSSLAQKRRKIRLSDESYYHFQHADRKEDLEAHELVEEMMILANTSVARYLAQRKAELLPLRVQLPPKTDKLNEWRESFGDCAKLSLSLRRHLLKDPVCTELFVVPASTWNDITRALRRRDKRELTHLIGNDNIYPQLCVARSLLNGLQRRAEDVRAADVPVNNRVHWSLNVLEYTRFTSPIRRYLDIEVHRLLLDSERQGVDFEDIPDLHRRCSLLSERSSMFETDCARIQFAVDLKDTACEIDAVVESIALDFIQLQFLRDANQYLSPSQRRVRISHLGPAEQPGVDESLTRVELNWTLRIYNASPENMKRARRSRNQERHLREDRIKIESLLPTTLNYSRLSHHIPGSLWLEVLDAVKEENFNRLKECLEDLRSRISRERERLAGDQLHEIMVEGTFNVEEQLEQPVQQEDDDAGNDEDDDSDENDGDSYDDDEDDDEDEKEDKDDDDEVLETNSEVTKDEENKLHFFDTTLVLRISDIVSVQLSTNETDAFISPDIQLFKLAPGINICVEHRKLADKCFAEVASEKASKQRYDSVIKYVKAWKPLLTMEAASNAVSNDDAVLLQNVEMKWKENDDRELVGEFKLDKNFCETRQIEILHGDYACVRVSCPTIFSTSSSNSGSFSTMESKLSHRDEYKEYSRSDNEGEADKNSLSGGGKRKEWYWVGHCIFTGADSIVTAVDKSLKFTLRLFQHSVNIPQGLQEGRICSCIVEIIKKTIPSRRMIQTLRDLPLEGTRLAHDICKGNATRLDALHIPLPDDNLSIADHLDGCNLNRLNERQLTAVRKSLRGRFTLIQGPPGTGKTITGVHIAYWFAKINRRNTPLRRTTAAEEIPDKAPPQVLYCGPSNRSVDVVAEYLMRIKGIKILRVYGKVIEEREFPIPNQVKPTRPFASQEELKVPLNLRRIALHLVIRDEERSPYAIQLRRYERLFAAKKKKKKRVEETTVEEYLQLIKKAETWAIRSPCEGNYLQIVLCTCSTAGSKRVKDACNNVVQCIVDECGMCMEPETLIPIVSSKAQQVVLIGDHMQLQPIVKNSVARSLGLRTSMFERFSDSAFMLEEQYRMHPDICEFPSQHFYQERLITPESVINRDRETIYNEIFINFWPSRKEKSDYVPLVFCNAVGEEEELVVTTEEGNQRSKSNQKEKDKVVEVVNKLVNTCGVRRNQIVVLSPYRAQCHVIREGLTNRDLSDIPVISIVKSQGSEWDFVIISLVRSLPKSQIDHEPEVRWLRENLGFVTDEHQINVALTRAKRGLCIIGNKNLLEVCEMWSYLIEHYRSKSCLVDSANWPWI